LNVKGWKRQNSKISQKLTPNNLYSLQKPKNLNITEQKTKYHVASYGFYAPLLQKNYRF
jgi:hypothetical protein